jgi:hypothetical protein
MSNVPKVKNARTGELINLPAAADMTNEPLMVKFSNIKAEYKESDTCRDLNRSLREYLSLSKIRIESCLCFGTETFSGYYNHKNMPYRRPNRHETAMYQLVLLKGATNLIGGFIPRKSCSVNREN